MSPSLVRRLPWALALAACSSTVAPPPPPDPVGSWRVDPQAALFPATAPGSTREATVLLRNTGELALEISGALAPADAPFTIEPARVSLAIGASAQVTLRYAPTAQGMHSATLTLTPDAAGAPTRQVALLGSTPMAGGPSVRTSSDALDFGEVLVGEGRALGLVIANEADEPLTLELGGDRVADCADLASTAPFCVESPASPLDHGRLSLPARATTGLELLFRPSAPGVEQAILGVRACGAASCVDGAWSVSLTGVGVEGSVACTPARLDFGRVGVTACATRSVRCESRSGTQRALTEIGLDPARTSTAFELLGAPSAVELPARGHVELEVRYCPGGPGADEGALVLATDDPSLASLEIPLAGAGGGPELEASPARLEYGRVAVGAPARRALTLRNAGDEPLLITSITAPAQASVIGGPTLEIPPGEARSLPVDLTLTAAGPFSGELSLESNDPDEGQLVVPISALAESSAPCSYEVSPPSLELGTIEPSRSNARAARITNTGAGDCVVVGARLLPGASDALALTEDPAGRVIAPGGSLTVGVRASPALPGEISGELELSISSPSAPLAVIPVHAIGEDSELLVSPSELDFGVLGAGCRARARTVRIYNVATAPVLITQLELMGPHASGFSLESAPTLTATIAPSAFTELSVGFAASGGSEDADALHVRTGTDARGKSYVIGLRGRTDPAARQVDAFEQLGSPQVDILWIIDDSGSMGEEQAALTANFTSFVRFADAQGLDYHLAVTTTDVANGERGRFEPLSGNGTRVVTPRTLPDPVSVFVANARVGTAGSGAEAGLEGAYLALSNPLISGHNAGFLRPEAALSVIFVSDEEDSSPRTLDFYSSFFLGIKGDANALTLSAIVGDSPGGCSGAGGSAVPGARYINVAERAGGIFQSICTPDWARALENVSTTAFGFKSRFVLRNQPVPSTITVEVDGVAIPEIDAQGSARWSYEPGSNAVAFTPFSTPEPGAQIRVEYDPECL